MNRSSSLLISEPPLQVLPSLAVKIGLNEAMVLQQIHYVILEMKGEIYNDSGTYWIRRTAEEWRETFKFWSVPTIRRILKRLAKLKYIKTTKKFNKVKTDQGLWYTIDYDLTNSSHGSDQVDHMEKFPAPADKDAKEGTVPRSDQVDHMNPSRDLIPDKNIPPSDEIVTSKPQNDPVKPDPPKSCEKPKRSRKEKPQKPKSLIPGEERQKIVEALSKLYIPPGGQLNGYLGHVLKTFSCLEEIEPNLTAEQAREFADHWLQESPFNAKNTWDKAKIQEAYAKWRDSQVSQIYFEVGEDGIERMKSRW